MNSEDPALRSSKFEFRFVAIKGLSRVGKWSGAEERGIEGHQDELAMLKLDASKGADV